MSDANEFSDAIERAIEHLAAQTNTPLSLLIGRRVPDEPAILPALDVSLTDLLAGDDGDASEAVEFP